MTDVPASLLQLPQPPVGFEPVDKRTGTFHALTLFLACFDSPSSPTDLLASLGNVLRVDLREYAIAYQPAVQPGHYHYYVYTRLARQVSIADKSRWFAVAGAGSRNYVAHNRKPGPVKPSEIVQHVIRPGFDLLTDMLGLCVVQLLLSSPGWPAFAAAHHHHVSDIFSRLAGIEDPVYPATPVAAAPAAAAAVTTTDSPVDYHVDVNGHDDDGDNYSYDIREEEEEDGEIPDAAGDGSGSNSTGDMDGPSSLRNASHANEPVDDVYAEIMGNDEDADGARSSALATRDSRTSTSSTITTTRTVHKQFIDDIQPTLNDISDDDEPYGSVMREHVPPARSVSPTPTPAPAPVAQNRGTAHVIITRQIIMQKPLEQQRDDTYSMRPRKRLHDDTFREASPPPAHAAQIHSQYNDHLDDASLCYGRGAPLVLYDLPPDVHDWQPQLHLFGMINFHTGTFEPSVGQVSGSWILIPLSVCKVTKMIDILIEAGGVVVRLAGSCLFVSNRSSTRTPIMPQSPADMHNQMMENDRPLQALRSRATSMCIVYDKVHHRIAATRKGLLLFHRRKEDKFHNAYLVRFPPSEVLQPRLVRVCDIASAAWSRFS